MVVENLGGKRSWKKILIQADMPGRIITIADDMEDAAR